MLARCTSEEERLNLRKSFLITLAEEGQTDTTDFLELLQAVAPSFPVVPVQATAEKAAWQTITVQGFSGVRFKVPFDTPADMRWGFVIKRKQTQFGSTDLSRWYIAACEGGMKDGFTDFATATDVDLPSVQVPRENLLVVQQLNGGQLQPGKEYLIWFCPHSRNVVDFDLKFTITLIPTGSQPPAANIDELARQAGLPYPVSAVSAEARKVLEQLADYVYDQDLKGALETGERALQLSPNSRQIRLMLASLYDSGGDQAKRLKDLTASASFYFKAAAQMRAIRDSFVDLSPAESYYYGSSLYNEARAFAVTGQPKKALDSLRLAFGAGYTNSTDVSSDPYFAAVRDVPEFKKLLSEFAARK